MNKNVIATPKATKTLPQKIQIFLHFLILSPHLIPSSLYSLSPINYPLTDSLSLSLSLSPLCFYLQNPSKAPPFISLVSPFLSSKLSFMWFSLLSPSFPLAEALDALHQFL
jgi:hypothetical protein